MKKNKMKKNKTKEKKKMKKRKNKQTILCILIFEKRLDK